MLRALYSAAAGMESQQMNLDVISNNLANVNTTGFKKSKIEFQDLLYQTTRAPGADQGSGNQLPTGIQIGHGSRVVATSRIFTNGELTQTGEQLDVAIQGDGFFEVQMPDGTRCLHARRLFEDGLRRPHHHERRPAGVERFPARARPARPTSPSRPPATSPTPRPTAPRPSTCS